MQNNHTTITEFSRFSFFLLCYALVIILWGAWVRISGSGDGCGPHWPLCKGQVWIDESFTFQAQTLIELTHRLKSGLFGILVLILFFWARRIFPPRHQGRYVALAVLFLTIVEALLGAKLVLLGLVGSDASPLRAFSMSLHLVNTLLLLFALTACWELRNNCGKTRFVWPKGKLVFCHFCVLIIATTGAWAALASTIFPSQGLSAGIQADFSTDSHWLLRIRIIHPLLALGLSLLIAYFLQRIKESATKNKLRLRINITQILIFSGIGVGLITLGSGSPTLLKLLHLLMADLVWISLTLVSLQGDAACPTTRLVKTENVGVKH